MKQIPLNHGKFALVDNEDYSELIKYKWHVNAKGYAARAIHIRREEGKKINKNILMHRLIMSSNSDEEVDHINGDRLDNRRGNLRSCTSADNSKNRKIYKNNNSGFKGVSFSKESNKFAANINSGGKRFYLGKFSTAIEAAITYNKAAIELHGEFANLNKIPQ